MAKRKLQYPIVKVFWNDACGVNLWVDDKEARHSCVSTISLGYMLKKTNLGVTVAASMNDQKQVNNVCFVPRGMITKIEVLRR